MVQAMGASTMLVIVPGSYPTRMPLHIDPLQYPKTPKSTPSKLASLMLLTIGVDRMGINNRVNARKTSADSGVAGRNMMSVVCERDGPSPPMRRFHLLA